MNNPQKPYEYILIVIDIAKKSRGLIWLSAVLYPIAFLFPKTCWWLSFLFLAPLFYHGQYFPITFINGFSWGFIAFGIHSYGIYSGLSTIGKTRWIFSVLFIIYLATCSGIWFLFTKILTIGIKKKNTLLQCIMFCITSLIFFLFLDHACLIIGGIIQGCSIFHPLLPLMAHPTLLQLLPITGKTFLTAILITTSASITACIIQITRIRFSIMLTILLFWFFNFQHPLPSELSPAWLTSIIHIPLQFPDQSSLEYITTQIITQKIKTNLDILLILMPESACRRSWSSYPEISTWYKNNSNKKFFCILGGFWHTSTEYYNTLYAFENNTCISSFHKKYIMPYREYLPSYLPDWCTSIFFGNEQTVTNGQEKRPLITANSIVLVPYICSELLCQSYPDDSYSNIPILALCNDMWCSPYVQYLMLLIAQERALSWQRHILYISYTYGMYIKNNGELITLNSYTLE